MTGLCVIYARMFGLLPVSWTPSLGVSGTLLVLLVMLGGGI